ncbi:hypothetical protein TSUD_127430 [Trifolium subterraneum]|nr:hypothetical protein TSUD_127430 [Trifolium subterraneum]
MTEINQLLCGIATSVDPDLYAGVHLRSDYHSATPDDQCDYYEVEYADHGSSIH